MFSYWEQQTFLSGIDVAIIGSGIVGLSAAIRVKQQQPQRHVAVFERGMLPSGASTKNAGFACFGSVSELLMDLETHPTEAVLALVDKRWRGLQRLRATLGDAALRYESAGGYELFEPGDFYNRCADHLPTLNAHLREIIGPTVYQRADTKLATFGFGRVKHLILNQYEGQLHTGRMLAALLDKARSLGVVVYNGAVIQRLEPTGMGVALHLPEGTVRVGDALIATNAFARQLLPNLDVQPGRGQVLVTSPIPNLRVKGTFHLENGYFYFRNIDGRILLGGGRHLDFAGEATTEFGLTERIQQRLEDLLTTVILPNQPYQIETRWSGIMGFGQQQAPLVRRVADHVVCGVKLQGMGVALGSLTGQEAADLLLEGLD